MAFPSHLLDFREFATSDKKSSKFESARFRFSFFFWFFFFLVLSPCPPEGQQNLEKSSGQENMKKRNHQHACKNPWQFGLHLSRFRRGPNNSKKFSRTGFAAGGLPNSQGWPTIFLKSFGQEDMKKKSHQHACKNPWQFGLHLPRFFKAPTLLKSFLKQVLLQGGPLNSQGWPTNLLKSFGQENMAKKSHQHACKNPWQFRLQLPRFRQCPNSFQKFLKTGFAARGRLNSQG